MTSGAIDLPGAGAAVKDREASAAYLIVHDDGDVVRASGWDRMFGVAAPERIPSGAGEADPLVAAIARAMSRANRTGGVAHDRAEIDRPEPACLSIAAASLALGGGNGTMVIVQSAEGRIDAGEGNAISRLEHDLRSPLTSIGGATELLESGRLGELTHEQMRCLGVVRRGVESLLGILMAAAAPFRSAAPLRNEDSRMVAGRETGEDLP